MADPHFTAQRAAWVSSRAGRNPDAQRRGQRLSARARRMARTDAGAGDAIAAEVTTRGRFARRAVEHDEHRMRWTAWALAVEAGRIALAGPGIGLSWSIYGAWYRQVPAWGPLRWRPLAVATGVVAAGMAVIAAVVWLGSGVPVWGWWLLAQPVIGIGRAAWLAYAYGWEAVPRRSAASDRPTPIRIRLGGEPELPVTEPLSPAPPVTVVRVSVPHNDNDNKED
ncbi:hypothetical protein [Gordonia sp. 852002-51296_SCH5728562-b]|uniref:hypothetical protein n=1 Tax=Gordonia sp. 852002-51296_SCH5728562-b TaxID=1834101 RepID=UPI0007EBADF9|nr:hypothetical protein [Gordonia sp. 852002-51296_SCH5728562-b]OBA39005.1 hypothetical protein A5766_04425 [Gordonia sp. 852002-51296_SCH5728562-b]